MLKTGKKHWHICLVLEMLNICKRLEMLQKRGLLGGVALLSDCREQKLVSLLGESELCRCCCSPERDLHALL